MLFIIQRFVGAGQTARGHDQATEAGQKIRAILEADGKPFKLYFYMSPYRRSSQTTEGIASCFTEAEIAGFQEEVQLREQDFGNFQVRASCPIVIVLSDHHSVGVYKDPPIELKGQLFSPMFSLDAPLPGVFCVGVQQNNYFRLPRKIWDRH